MLHVVPGALLAEDLQKAEAIKTEGGEALKVSVSKDLKEINLGDAQVMLPKEEAKNGFVYPLDTVLLPTTTPVLQRRPFAQRYLGISAAKLPEGFRPWRLLSCFIWVAKFLCCYLTFSEACPSSVKARSYLWARKQYNQPVSTVSSKKDWYFTEG